MNEGQVIRNVQYSFHAQEPGNHVQYKTFHVTTNAREEKIFASIKGCNFTN